LEIAPASGERFRESCRDLLFRMNLIPFEYRCFKLSSAAQRIYGLRLGDSIQLGSANHLQKGPTPILFLSNDSKLNGAARNEGFEVLLPE
jgi:hypothetical protein